MTPIIISASLVLYKPDVPTVERTLHALQEATRVAKEHYPLRLELTLVDNSNDDELHSALILWLDGFRAVLPDWELQLVRAPNNLGFGRGHNIAIASAQSEYHLIVNPDLFVEVDTLLEAIRFMEDHPDVGLLSPAVFGEDGERHYLCKRHPTLLIMFLLSFSPKWFQRRLSFVIDKFEMRDCDYNKPISPLEYPTGCFMVCRTAPLKAIGGFDPAFFLHYEDADIGRRMLRVARVVYVPTVRVVHRWARETHRALRPMLITVRSGWQYWRKWGGVFSSRPAIEPFVTAPCRAENSGPDPATGASRRVLVTGANGFIGRALCVDLQTRGYRVSGAVRKDPGTSWPTDVPFLVMGNIDEHTDWSEALSGIDCVVHLAARVHFMQETDADPLKEYRRANVTLTLNLARQAAASGVRRFVFISSIKVNGEKTPVGQPFLADDVPHPIDPYGISKLEAEQALGELASQTGMEVVILRPVLVYGPGVKANFYQMMRWVTNWKLMPFGALHNQRSLVALDNLVDCIAVCIRHLAAANQTFLVSDGEDLTVTALLQRTATALGKPSTLLPIPGFVLKLAGGLLDKESVVQRLCEPLQVDITKTRRQLDWSPPVTVDAALRKTARKFLES